MSSMLYIGTHTKPRSKRGNLKGTSMIPVAHNKPVLYSHNWVSNNVTELKCYHDHDQKQPNEDGQIGILIVGTTGTGKSSICGLLSGDNSIQGKGGAERGSSSTQFIRSKYNPNIYFIDTMGTKDSDITLTDEQILKSALKDVHQKRINKIKIIWTVGRETDKTDRKGPFNREAQFISALQIAKDDKVDEKEGFGSSENKIWSSVMIVQKRGKPLKSKKNISAILAAINDYGSTNDIEKDLNAHYFGFKCTNFSEDFETDNSEYEEWDLARKERKGYYTKERAREEMNQILNKLPLYEINFRKEKCTKCGVIGDSRYVHAPCHTKKIMLHTLSVSYRHPGQLRYFHNKGVKETNSGEWKYRYHPGLQTQLHTGVAQLKHPKDGKEISSRFEIFAGIASSWHWHHDKWSYYYECCNNYGKWSKGCKLLYTCCGEHKSSRVCVNAIPIWSCCGKESKEKGCKGHIQRVNKVHGCCGKQEGSEGCKMEFSCCKGIGKGCDAFYPCCNRRITKRHPPGCTAKCDRCRRDWGKPLDDFLPGGCSVTKI